MTNWLREGERLDDLNRKGYQIIQNPSKFCFGMDAVLLSAFAQASQSQRVIDLGTGTGIIPILMEARGKGGHFVGLEVQEESADMARRSVSYNHLEDKIDIVTGDIKEASLIFQKASFDVVTTNPPYMNDNHGLKNPHMAKAIARHEVLCSLEDVIRESAGLLKPKGKLFMVHRPHRLSEIITLLHDYHLEPKRMRLVYPYAEKEANMVLIEALRGGRSMMKVEAPLIVYRETGVYTEEIHKLYYA